MRVWTLVSRDTVAHARVLAAAVAAHHPGTEVAALRIGPPLLERDEPFRVVALETVAAGLGPRLAAVPWGGAHLLARAAVLRFALAEGDDPVVLVDPEVDVRAPLDPLLAELGSREVALVPRTTAYALPADGRRPGPGDLAAAGLFEPLLLAARRGEQASTFLGWWTDRLASVLDRFGPGELAQLRREPMQRLSTWLDLAPSRFPGVGVVEDPGVGLSAWNLHERSLGLDGAVGNGAPVRAIVLEGFDPHAPHWLREGADRVRVPGDPALRALCEDRAAALLGAGWAPPAAVEPGTALPGGLIADERALALMREAEMAGADFGDVRTEAGARALLAHLREPADGARHGINRYVARVWTEREDVMRVFPDLRDDDDARRFAEWAWEWGRPEMAIPDVLLPPVPEGFAAPDLPGREPAPPPPVHVAGFMRGTLGLGAAARLYVEAVAAAGLDVSTTTVDVPAAGDDVQFAEVDFEDRAGSGPEVPGVDIVCVNADELPMFAARMGDRFGAARRTIGVWAWETDHIPERWGPMYGMVDEIWTYTRYVAENIARVAPVPVIPIPIPVPTPDPSGVELDLGLPDADFTFLFVFDFFSTPARKNPAGLIEAFTRAFQPGEGPRLIIKTLHGDLRPAALDRLRWLAGDREGRDIHLVDRSLSLPERDALMDSCDCYVSLHRAEGFGLTPAEAMALGKPVIATAYSGTLDFMNQMNSYLVDYTMTKVGPEGEHYPADGLWADPSVEHAAHLMRHVIEHPTDAAAKGAQARAHVEEHLSPLAVGRLIRSRVAALDARGLLSST